MALEQRTSLDHADPDNFGADVYERDTGRSNFTSFLIGGVVVAVGLFAFLFYDGGEMNGRDMSISGPTTIHTPAASAVPSIDTPAGSSAPAGQ